MTPSPSSRRAGLLFGQAVGDALGLGAEGLSKALVRRYYPKGLRDFDSFLSDRHRRMWRPGDWTDDTEQALCLLECLLDNGRLDQRDFARRLYRWMQSDGRGIGGTTRVVLSTPGYLSDPVGVARAAWEQSGRYLAANGAVMRTSVLAFWEQDPARLAVLARQAAAVTHADPRCASSCVLVSSVLAALLRGECDLQAVLERATAETSLDAELTECLNLANATELSALALDGEGAGCTYRTAAAGLWAVLHADSFEAGLVSIMNEGGDADTNGAVAGALLGARFGVAAIPAKLLKGLKGRHLLHRLLLRLEDMRPSPDHPSC